jgi:hypothetical protein
LERAGSFTARSAQVIDCRTWGRKSSPLCAKALFERAQRTVLAPSAVAVGKFEETKSSKFLGISIRFNPKANYKYTILSKSVNISQRTLLFFQINFANILKKI